MSADLIGKIVRVKEGCGTCYLREGDTGRVVRIDYDGDAWVRWNNPNIRALDNTWCSAIDRLEIVDDCDTCGDLPESNANLISAAPELLEELESAVLQMEMAAECVESGRRDEAILHLRSHVRQKRAVIAKARGEA